MELKRKVVSLFVFWLIALPLLAQESNFKRITLDKDTLSRSYLLDNQEGSLLFKPTAPLSTPLQLTAVPSSTPILPEPLPVFQLADYRRAGASSLAQLLFLYLERERRSYQLISSYTSGYVALGVNLGERLSIIGGGLAVKQFSGLSPYSLDRMGVKLGLNYDVTDRLNLNVWGYHLIDMKSQPIPDSFNLLLPKSGIGGSATLKVGEHAKIGISTWVEETEGNVSFGF